jgi:DNA-binding CsgD family transcriptional regulator
MRPPFPGVVSNVIWIVSRLDAAKVSAFLPPALAPAAEMIGVLGIYDAPSGSPISPYARAFGGVTVEGHQSPDSRDAVYVIGDLVSANAIDAWRETYLDACLLGEPRVWREGELLHASVGTAGKEWMRVTVRQSGPPHAGVTGQDCYLSRNRRGVVRHVVSYYGAVAPCEVVSISIAESAPLAFAALKPEKILLGLTAQDLHTTWGESRPLPPDDTAHREATPRDLPALLRAVGLTPAEARLAALYGSGNSARQAAQRLGISEHTAKSTLKQVYGKLGLRKQSELGQLIARLG